MYLRVFDMARDHGNDLLRNRMGREGKIGGTTLTMMGTDAFTHTMVTMMGDDENDVGDDRTACLFVMVTIMMMMTVMMVVMGDDD